MSCCTEGTSRACGLGYTGADKRVQRKKLKWQIAAKRGKIKAMADGLEKRKLEKIEQRKASVRRRWNIRSGSSSASSA